MGETGESIGSTGLKEIKIDTSVVGKLKELENGASKEKFVRHFSFTYEGKPVERYKLAAIHAAREATILVRDTDVAQEMVNLGIKINLGKNSFSVRPDDKRESREAYKPILMEIGLNGENIVVRPDEFNNNSRISSRIGNFAGTHPNFITPEEGKFEDGINQLLEDPQKKKEVWQAVESLANLSPRDIVRAFRKGIENKQAAIGKEQKLQPKKELDALRRGH